MIQHCPRCGAALPTDARIVRKEGAPGCAPVFKVTHAIPGPPDTKPRICGGYTGPPHTATAGQMIVAVPPVATERQIA